MDVSLVKPVVSSAEKLLREIGSPVAMRGGLELRHSLSSDYPIHVLLGVKGGVKGIVRYSFDFGFIDNLVESVGDDDTHVKTDHAKIDVMKELAVAMFDEATNGFLGAKVSRTKPTAYKQNDMPSFPATQTVAASLHCELGKLEIGVCLRRV